MIPTGLASDMKARPLYIRPIHASREGTRVRFVSTLSVSHRLFDTSPLYLSPLAAGAGDEAASTSADDPDIFLLFASACWSCTAFFHFPTTSDASLAMSLFGLAFCFATII